MTRAVLMILDGLRPDMVTPELCPNLVALEARGRRFARHRAVFPSVTRASAASIATGCHPRRHGLAGNVIAVANGSGFALLDAGRPEFRERLRALKGRVLLAPTLAERLAGDGGAIIMTNSSPGAAYLHDPDGHGHVYNRGGSYGPGLRRLPDAEGLTAAKGPDGDRAVTRRFCDDALLGRRPALAVLWLSEPDSAGHDHGLGSQAHRRALAAADGCVGEVVAAVEAMRREGLDVLLLVGSDHGQETVREVVRLDARLAQAGVIEAPGSDEIVLAPQGSGALVYLRDPARAAAVARALAAQPEVAEVFAGEALARRGLPEGDGLAVAVAMRAYDEPNEHGVFGLSDAAASDRERGDAKPRRATHGGLGRNESGPYLVACGRGFAAGTACGHGSSVVDTAPTLLRHLGRGVDGLDGRPLQEL